MGNPVSFRGNLIGVVVGTFCVGFVKIILLKSDNCVLTLRKRLFCAAKPTLLPCKTAAFGMQNNRFCNTLITRQLSDSCTCEKYLQFYNRFSVYKMMNRGEVLLLSIMSIDSPFIKLENTKNGFKTPRLEAISVLFVYQPISKNDSVVAVFAFCTI